MNIYTRQDFLDLYKLIKKKQHKKLYSDLTSDKFSCTADQNLGKFIVGTIGYKLNKDSRDRFIELIKTNENLYYKFI